MPYEKIGKNEPVCIADEVPFEIPESWEWVRLGTVCEIARGGSPRPIKQFLTDSPSGVNWIKISDSDKGGKYINATKEKIIPAGVTKSRYVHAGDFLLTNSMSFGRPYILNVDGCIHDGWLVLSDYQNAYDKDFLFYMLSSAFAYSQFCDIVSGAVVKNLNSDKVSSVLFPLPPITEQRRIVTKLNRVEKSIIHYTKSEDALSNLTNSFPQKLTKSILQEAVQGKLVPQDPADEPASALLERIRAEKEHLIKSGKIKRDKRESVIFRRDNSYYERVDGIERCIDDEIPFEIPESWEWCRLGELIETIDTGKSFKCEERPPDKNEYGIIKVSAVTWGTFNQEESKTCFSTSPWVKGYSIQVDDFLICRANTAALVGGCVIVDKISKRLMLSDKVLRIEFSDSISKTYVLYTLRTPFVRAQLSAAASGTSESMKNISQNAIKGLLIPFPPIKEQYRIVSKVEESLSKIKTL